MHAVVPRSTYAILVELVQTGRRRSGDESSTATQMYR
jgi:hypothetical protein